MCIPKGGVFAKYTPVNGPTELFLELKNAVSPKFWAFHGG